MVKYIIEAAEDMKNVMSDVSEIEIMGNWNIFDLIIGWKYRKYINILNLIECGMCYVPLKYPRNKNVLVKIFNCKYRDDNERPISTEFKYEIYINPRVDIQYFDNVSGLISLETYQYYTKVGIEIRNKMLDRYERYYFNHTPLLKFSDYDLIFEYGSIK